jgi:hypothetical protein
MTDPVTALPLRTGRVAAFLRFDVIEGSTVPTKACPVTRRHKVN